MKYEVLLSFTDGQDRDAPEGKNVYWAGQAYPRDGYDPGEKRISYLTSAATAFKRPVIARKGNQKGGRA